MLGCPITWLSRYEFLSLTCWGVCCFCNRSQWCCCQKAMEVYCGVCNFCTMRFSEDRTALQCIDGLAKGELLAHSPTQRSLRTPKTSTASASSCVCSGCQRISPCFWKWPEAAEGFTVIRFPEGTCWICRSSYWVGRKATKKSQKYFSFNKTICLQYQATINSRAASAGPSFWLECVWFNAVLHIPPFIYCFALRFGQASEHRPTEAKPRATVPSITVTDLPLKPVRCEPAEERQVVSMKGKNGTKKSMLWCALALEGSSTRGGNSDARWK